NEYDLIIVCEVKVLGVLGVAAAQLLKKKCILRAESCGEMDGAFAIRLSTPPSWVKRQLIKLAVLLRNRLLMRADVFVSISTAITKEFKVGGVRSEANVQIPNGS